MMIIKSYSDELYHHGIKGMKWGVRRYQNKDGSLTPAGRKKYLGNDSNTPTRTINKDDVVIKRGSVQSHVSDQKKLKLTDKETYLYDNNNKHDMMVYEGAYAKYIEIGKRRTKQYIHDYVVTEDLISPSEQKRVEIFLESYRNDPVKYYTEMNAVQKMMKLQKDYGYNLTKRNENIANYTKEFNEKTSNADLKKYGYDALNVLGEYGSARSQAVSAYYNSVKDKGYNALVDDNNRSVYNDAVQPFIALNGKKTLKELNVYNLSTKERNSNIESLRDYTEKKYGTRNIAL